MTHHDAFLADICANPDDDTPRLIYADWLEEYGGQPERAEFIRVQCRLAKGCEVCDGSGKNVMSPCNCSLLRRREQRLFEDHIKYRLIARGNVGDINAWQWQTARWEDWRRGFVWSIEIVGNFWVELADELLRHVPLQQVRLAVLPTIERSFGPFPDGRCIASIRGTDKPMGVPNDDYLAAKMLLPHCWPGIEFILPPHPTYTLTINGRTSTLPASEVFFGDQSLGFTSEASVNRSMMQRMFGHDLGLPILRQPGIPSRPITDAPEASDEAP